ncbi:MAG TPA: polysaccharide biosynthesis C-terminal domain-containing protein [Bacilli bacterium]|nr:polysaccharide biosynthesis C-terminal domain-containing protein [Bacilli bacterium]
MTRKQLRPNIVVNLIRTLTITLLSFISFPFASTALGDVAMGQYSWANTFVYFFLIIAKLGIPTVAIRECSKVKDDPVLLAKKIQTYFFLQLITTLISYAAMFIIVFGLNDTVVDLTSRPLVMLLSLNFLVGVFSFEWVFITLEKHFYIALRSIFTGSIGLLLVIMFVRNDRHLFTYAFLAMFTTFATVIINLFMLRQEKISLIPKDKIVLKGIFKPLIIIFLITLIVTAYNQADSLLLGYVDESKSLVGSYAVGVRGIEIVITIITSLSAVFIPRATMALKNNNIKEFNYINNYSTNITFFIALPAVTTMIILAPQIVGFIVTNDIYWSPTAIENAVWAIMILSALMFTYSLGDNIYQQVLIPLGKEKIYFYTMIGGLILNLGLSITSVFTIFKDYPLIGVSLSTMVSDILVLGLLIFLTRKHVYKNIFNNNNLKIVIATAIIGVITYFMAPRLNIGDPLMLIISAILIAGSIYIIILAILKEDIVRETFSKSKQD